MNDNSKSKPQRLPGGVYLIFVVLFIDLMAFAVILPLLPSILDYYNDVDEHKDISQKDGFLSLLQGMILATKNALNIPDTRRYNNVLIGGFLGSLYSLLQFLINPITGGLSDAYGRKPILIVSMIGTAISYWIWLYSETFTMFLISRIISGVSKASVTISTASVTDMSNSALRGKAMALVGVAFSLGFIGGPLLGAYFAGRALRTSVSTNPFILPAKLCLGMQLVDVVLAIVFVKESLPLEKRKPFITCFKNSFSLINPMKLFSPPTDSKQGVDVGRLCWIHFIYLLLFAGLEFTLTFLTHERFSFENAQQGKLFLFIGLIMIITQGGYVRRAKPGKEKSMALLGIVALMPGMIIVGLAWNTATLYFGLLLFSFGAGTVISLLTTMFTKQGTSSGTGEMLGFFRSCGALARAIGPFLTCAVYWSLGSKWCYSIGGFLFVVPLILLLGVKNGKQD